MHPVAKYTSHSHVWTSSDDSFGHGEAPKQTGDASNENYLWCKHADHHWAIWKLDGKCKLWILEMGGSDDRVTEIMRSRVVWYGIVNEAFWNDGILNVMDKSTRVELVHVVMFPSFPTFLALKASDDWQKMQMREMTLPSIFISHSPTRLRTCRWSLIA